MKKETKKQRDEYKEFVKQRGPEYAKDLKEIRKQHKESMYGKDVITRGKNKGLKRGTGRGM